MATIIRRDREDEVPAGDAVRPAVFTLSDMETQGESYVRVIRAEASKTVQEAKDQADAVRKAAEAEGRRAAETSINELLDRRIGEQMQTLRPALDAAVATIADSRGEWLDHWEKSAIRLAAAMAERIVRRELSQDPAITTEWVREALELTAGDAEVTVLLHPDDHKRIASQIGPLAESIGRIAKPRVVADPALSPGGCRVETKYGSVDQQLETQLERLQEELS